MITYNYLVDPEEEKGVSLLNDVSKCREINISLNKHFFESSEKCNHIFNK